MTTEGVLVAAEGHAAMSQGGPGAGVIAACRMAWVEGPDAEALLQGLLTADISALAEGGSADALVLTTHGHVVARVRVIRDAPDAFTLVLDPAPAPDALEVIRAHHVSEDADVLGPEDMPALIIGGGATERVQAVDGVVAPGVIPGTVVLVTDDPEAVMAHLKIPMAPADSLESLRVDSCVPRIGVDTGEKTLVQEAGLDDAVSFSKGCYLGQETVARLHYRGRANRRLCRIGLPGPFPLGTALRTADGREAGVLTSIADVPGRGWTGLAMIRREVRDGDCVTAEGLAGECRVLAHP